MSTICAPNYAYVFMGKFERTLYTYKGICTIYTTICEHLLSIYRQSFLFVEQKREKTFRFYCQVEYLLPDHKIRL